MPGPPRPTPKATADSSIIITVDGTAYELRPNEINALDSQACRRETGMSVRALLATAQDDPDIDTIAALVWLARRQAGEPSLAFETIAATISYGSSFDLGNEDTGPGEALAAS